MLDLIITGPARWFEEHIDFLSVQGTLLKQGGMATNWWERMVRDALAAPIPPSDDRRAHSKRTPIFVSAHILFILHLNIVITLAKRLQNTAVRPFGILRQLQGRLMGAIVVSDIVFCSHNRTYVREPTLSSYARANHPAVAFT